MSVEENPIKEDEAPVVNTQVIPNEPVVSKEAQKKHIKSFKEFVEDQTK